VPIQVTCPSCQGMFNAPDTAAGKRAKCPKCGGVIEIPTPAVGDEVFDAEEEVRSPFTDEDFDVEPPPQLPAGDDRKPCPMCGEMIQKDAVKCRYCGEVFDPVLRKKELKSRKHTQVDEDMTTGDWVVAIICSGIGCIAGIIWMIQGKPKGKKMILVSFLASLVWSAIRVILETMTQNMR
jgi:DNA-directed RNA polymerase subunit M/transcription elongation factor TFIIS